ncbi:MAG: glycerol-3-phosphate acyltransferase, partial [Candidatus Omnitrophica bacterium]|nr:glycerol-3-phosphate acyltransferase [Candidatus Omnitrophota bacterium]
MLILIPILTSFFLGSIPFGFLCVYAVKKIDIRNFGSSNIGATNVTRVLGRQWGIFVFILDFLKGFLAPLLVKIFVKDASNFLFIIASIVAVCGHNW